MADINSSAKRGAGGKFESAKRSDGGQARGSDGRDFVDPNAAGQAAGEPTEPGERIKRRDPPAGGGTTANGAKAGAKKSASLDMSAAAGLISGFHAIVAMQRNEPHWLLSDAD